MARLSIGYGAYGQDDTSSTTVAQDVSSALSALTPIATTGVQAYNTYNQLTNPAAAARPVAVAAKPVAAAGSSNMGLAIGIVAALGLVAVGIVMLSKKSAPAARRKSKKR